MNSVDGVAQLGEPSAVVADVQDQALFVHKIAHKDTLELLERIRKHVGELDIPQTSIGEFLDGTGGAPLPGILFQKGPG